MSYVVGLFLAALTLSIASSPTHGTGQHMICNLVEDDFTDESNNNHQPSTGRRALQGPQGKRCQTWVKGEPGISGSKGQKGLPGIVDPENVESVIEEKLDAATAALQAKIRNLEQKVAEISDISFIQCSISGDIFYQGKCYYAVALRQRDVSFTDAERMCTGKGGKLADILDRRHERFVEKYLREKIRGREFHIQVWTAMNYTSSTLRLSNGNVVTSLRWLRRTPYTGFTWPEVAIYVYKSTSRTSGIFNHPPTHPTHGALCEK